MAHSRDIDQHFYQLGDRDDFMATPDDIQEFTIRASSMFGNALGDCANEIERAIRKHGVYQTPMNPSMSNAERLVILVEEVGEVARAMTYDNGDPDELDKELIQVATMALATVVGNRLRRDHEQD